MHKLLSLFDGSGGFPLAASMCGIEPVAASEIEPYPIAVTRSRFSNMKHLADINGAEIEPVDIITFGSPCQDLSVAGKRAGLKHEANGDEETTRSGLFMEAVRIIKEMRKATNGAYPTFALWENVPGAFSSNKGEDFRTVLEELIKIVEPGAVMPPVPSKGWPYADSYCGDGWSLAYRVFDAQYWGVPQRRRRIHLILDLRGERAGKVLFEREGVRGDFAESGAARQGATVDATDCSGADDREVRCVAFHLLQDPIPNGDVFPCMGQGNSDHGQASIGVCCPVVEQLQPERAVGLDIYNLSETGDVAASLTTATGQGASNTGPSVCVKTYDARGNGDGVIASKRTGDHENRITDYTSVVVEPIPIHDQATRFSGKRGDKSDGKGNGLGVGNPGDPMNTLTSGDRHAVAYGINGDVAGTLDASYYKGCGERQGVEREVVCQPVVEVDGFKDEKCAACYAMQAFGKYVESETASAMKARDYKDATDLVLECAGVDCRNFIEHPNLYPTLQAKPNGGQSLNFSGAVRVRYIVRRLTPTECARLQGFPDTWGHPDHKEDFTDEEYRFWLEVRNTHAAINGKAVKEYTKEQMLKWYNGLHTDSAEYKMWGNGIALPPALYCMQGIAEALHDNSR